MKSLEFLMILEFFTVQVFSFSYPWQTKAPVEDQFLTKPSFCRNYECPKYTVISSNDDYELRQYDTSRWAVTEMDREGPFWEDRRNSSKAYWKLFSYRNGNNAQKMEMQMNVPVLLYHEREKVMMSFLIPTELENNPPQPNDKTVKLFTAKHGQVYVRSFSGFSYGWWNNRNYYKNEMKALKDCLTRDGIDADNDRFYTAGYDSPWTFWYRHNEVWIPKKN